MRIVLIILFANILCVAKSQPVKYSSAWFGPNANPVPEMTDGRIPAKTTLSLTIDYYFGFGDETLNEYLKIEVPLLPQRVSCKIWTTLFESYRVTEEVKLRRKMENTMGTANGDFYVQTRISLLKEKKKAPEVILNATLKTASGTNFGDRRYFDTPGYYFDVETAKSIHTKGRFINEIRGVANVGFLCWETSESTQNDAVMYGGKVIIGNQRWKLENSLSGYSGWMHSNHNYSPDYGDAPLIYTSKLSVSKDYIDYFVQYQYGIKDFPYHQIRIGISLSIDKLTPNYNPPLLKHKVEPAGDSFLGNNF